MSCLSGPAIAAIEQREIEFESCQVIRLQVLLSKHI